MITAQDVKSGYGQKIEKPHTSVLPYLRAQVKSEEEIRTELQKEYEKIADKGVTDAIKKKEKARLDQYDEARLEILSGQYD
ncbi:MAG: hypothetical protein Q4E24_10215 [bacterium]|nr:hypothetical protein [bacterium]